MGHPPSFPHCLTLNLAAGITKKERRTVEKGKDKRIKTCQTNVTNMLKTQTSCDSGWINCTIFNCTGFSSLSPGHVGRLF